MPRTTVLRKWGRRTCKIVAGGHFGDEGKGIEAADEADEYDIGDIIRSGGANNCGHQGERDGKPVKTHHLPLAAVLSRHRNIERTAIIAGSSLIMPHSWASPINGNTRVGLMDEVEGLRKNDFHCKLIVDPRCGLILPPHLALEAVQEHTENPFRIGTTGSGVGWARAMQDLKMTIRVVDCLDKRSLEAAIDRANWQIRQFTATKHASFRSCKDILLQFGDWLRRNARVVDTNNHLQEVWASGGSLLYEMPQAHGLDMLMGTTPYTTSSYTLYPVGVWVPTAAVHTTLVFKAGYQTRVGGGPFIGRHNTEMEALLRKLGKEVGVSTGRARDAGAWDAVHAREAVNAACGTVSVVLTKLDVISGIQCLAVTAYKHRSTGDIITRWPLNVLDLSEYEPVIEPLPTFDESLDTVESWNDLPKGALALIKRTEQLMQLPHKRVRVIGVRVGAEIGRILWRDKKPSSRSADLSAVA